MRSGATARFGIPSLQTLSRNVGNFYNRVGRVARKMWVAFPLLRPVPFLLLGIALYGMGRKAPSSSQQIPNQAQAVNLVSSVTSPTPPESVSPAPVRAKPVRRRPRGLVLRGPIPLSRSALVNIQIENEIPQGNVMIWWTIGRFITNTPGRSEEKLGIFEAGSRS
jgi:hypothetical protein